MERRKRICLPQQRLPGSRTHGQQRAVRTYCYAENAGKRYGEDGHRQIGESKIDFRQFRAP